MNLSRRSFLELFRKGTVAVTLGGVLAACGDGEDSIYTKSKPILERVNDNQLNTHINNLGYFAFNSSANQIDYDFSLPNEARLRIHDLTEEKKITIEEENILRQLIDFYVDRITLRYNPNG